MLKRLAVVLAGLLLTGGYGLGVASHAVAAPPSGEQCAPENPAGVEGCVTVTDGGSETLLFVDAEAPVDVAAAVFTDGSSYVAVCVGDDEFEDPNQEGDDGALGVTDCEESEIPPSAP